MMRNAGRLKLGYYPLPQEEGIRLRGLLHFIEQASVLDPCAGTGAALLQITSATQSNRYAVELDGERALECAASDIATIQGSVFDTHSRVESFSLLYLNPPYDSEIGPMANQRMEYLFLEHTYRWLVLGGVLLLVIPFDRLSACEELLAANFTDLRVFRLNDLEAVRFKQIAVVGIRKQVRGSALELNRTALHQTVITRKALLNLDEEQAVYSIPGSPKATLVYRGLPLDQVEDLIPGSAAWKQVTPFLLPKEEMAGGRPITPLHGGHVGLLCTAGLLNGVFGYGPDRHIARWRSVKHTSSFEERDGDMTITRKRERFSNELTLVYEDGRTLLLTESPQKGKDDAECASSTGAA
jgi:Uncharacterised methyltransferase family (DUF6094)